MPLQITPVSPQGAAPSPAMGNDQEEAPSLLFPSIVPQSSTSRQRLRSSCDRGSGDVVFRQEIAGIFEEVCPCEGESKRTSEQDRGGSHSRCTWHSPFLRKPMGVITEEEEKEKLARRLSLYDLLAVGIGGTVGSGVFVLAGEIANAPDLPAGPSVVLSFAAAGFACFVSGLSFAELASGIHADGSSYVYAYVHLGEIFAFWAGCCLTLEYGVSSAAVARNWGDKLGAWVNHLHTNDNGTTSIWQPGTGDRVGMWKDFNIYAGAIQFICMTIMLRGLNVSRLAIDVMTLSKMVLVIFITIAGFCVFAQANLAPFAPSGFQGILRGGMRCFFGYLGFDEVCCLAGEAKQPAKNIPRAVMGTIGIVTFLYFVAALALVGMQNFSEISTSSGFAEAFRARNLLWIANVVAVGELLTLPLVVFVSLLAQPRLQFAMAQDGLLPAILGKVDKNGNLFFGTLVAGLTSVAIALFLPFGALEDVISAGVLIAFNFTNSALMVSRRSRSTLPHINRIFVLVFNISTFIACCLWQHTGFVMPWLPVSILSTCVALLSIVLLEIVCPDQIPLASENRFRTPCVPWIPAVGAAMNYFLLVQLSIEGLGLVMVYLGISLLFYAMYSFHNSQGGKNGWRGSNAVSLRRHSRHSTETDPQLIAGLLNVDEDEDEDHATQKQQSLAKDTATFLNCVLNKGEK